MASSSIIVGKASNETSSSRVFAAAPVKPRSGSSAVPRSQTASMQDFRTKLENDGLSTEAADLVMSSWKPATKTLYDRFIVKWKVYAENQGVDPFNPAVHNVANFLAYLFSSGMSYSSLNNARSALSAWLPFIDGVAVGSHQTISRLMKGVYNQRPNLPKYTETWDVTVMLQYLSTLPATEAAAP